MIRQSGKQVRIFVVDDRPGDYDDLVAATLEHGDVRFEFFRTAREALRTHSADSPDMWVVNMNLPDMAGAELHTMLLSRGADVPMLLVGDAYSAEDELAARVNGASLYFAKPIQREWLFVAEPSAA